MSSRSYLAVYSLTDSHASTAQTALLPDPSFASQSNESDSSTKKRRSRGESASPERKLKGKREATSSSQEKKESAPPSQESKDFSSVKFDETVKKVQSSRTSGERNREGYRHRSHSRGAESAPRSQEVKHAAVKWDPMVEKAESSRTSGERNRDEFRHRSHSRGTSGRSDSIRSASRSPRRTSPSVPSSSQQKDSTEFRRHADSRSAVDMGARHRDPTGPGARLDRSRPDSWIAGGDSNSRGRAHDQRSSRSHWDDNNRNHEPHRLPKPPGQSSASRGLDYGFAEGSAEQAQSGNLSREDRNSSHRHDSGHRVPLYGPRSEANRSNDNGHPYGSNGHAHGHGHGHDQRGPHNLGEHHDSRGGGTFKDRRLRPTPTNPGLQQRPPMQAVNWPSEIQNSTAGFSDRPGWRPTDPGQNSSQSRPALGKDYRPAETRGPSSQNGQRRRENEERRAPPRIDPPRQHHPDRESLIGTGVSYGQRTEQRGWGGPSTTPRGRSRDPADDRPISPQREHTNSSARDETTSLKRPASPLPVPEDRSAGAPLNKRQRVDSEPTKDRTETPQQDMQMSELPSLPPDAPPGPPEDEIPPAPPSPPPAPPPEPSESSAMELDLPVPPSVSVRQVEGPSVLPDGSAALQDLPSETAPVELEVTGGASAMSIIEDAPAVMAESEIEANTVTAQSTESLAVPGAPVPMAIINPIPPLYSPALPPPVPSLATSPVISASQAGTVWRQLSPMPRSSPTMPAGVVQSFSDPSRATTPNPNAAFSLEDFYTPATNGEGLASGTDKEVFIRRKGDKLDPADDLKAFHKIFEGTARLDDFIMPTGADKKDATLGKGTFGYALIFIWTD